MTVTGTGMAQPTTTMTSSTNTGVNTVIYASVGDQLLSTMVHLLGCSVLSACFVRRLAWRNLTLSKLCVMGILADSWLFLFSSGLVVGGIGLSLNRATCMTGIYLCIFFYASSKFLIYLFLTERVHLVWHANKPTSRLKSRVWIICIIALSAYIAVFVLMLIGRIGYIRNDQVCVIGLKHMASIPLLSYDVFVNIALTGLFVYPLLRKWVANPRLLALAKSTCFAASIALGTSVVNMLILTLFNGQQLGWVCLASCGFDVTVNAVAIYFITRKPDNSSTPASKGRDPLKGDPSRISHRHSTGHPLAAISSVLPVLRIKRQRTHGIDTQSDGWPHTFSRIGDFASTRDDGGIARSTSFGVGGNTGPTGEREPRHGSFQPERERGRERERSFEWGRTSRQYQRTESNTPATVAEESESASRTEGHQSFLPFSREVKKVRESREMKDAEKAGWKETRVQMQAYPFTETQLPNVAQDGNNNNNNSNSNSKGSSDDRVTTNRLQKRNHNPDSNQHHSDDINGFDSQGLQSVFSGLATSGEVPSFRATPISWREDEKGHEKGEVEEIEEVESFVLSMSNHTDTGNHTEVVSPKRRTSSLGATTMQLSPRHNDSTFGIPSRTTRPSLDVHTKPELQ